MASKKTMEIVKSTAPVLQEHGETITKVFYKHLFENNPELRDVFNMTHQKKGTQPKALANAVYQYAVHIDKLDMLSGAVESIAHKHASLSVPKEAYPIVGKNLLIAIKEVLGNAATDEIMDAWAEAYEDLAAIFVDKEEDIYSSKEKEIGGYRGTQEYTVIKKEKESSVITSFYLKRTNSEPVPKFKGGQYVAITIDIPGTDHKHTRNYSLSDSHNKEYLRISVKKEEGNPDGIVSNYLHSDIEEGSKIQIGIPAGEFVLTKNNQPSVFIAGGVGVTPLLSMAKEAVANGQTDITFIQCCLNSEVHAFKNEIMSLLPNEANYVTAYSSPLEDDSEKYDYVGMFKSDILNDLNITKESNFYFCGPKPFMSTVFSILKDNLVEEQNIHFEFFGPSEELNNA